MLTYSLEKVYYEPMLKECILLHISKYTFSKSK